MKRCEAGYRHMAKTWFYHSRTTVLYVSKGQRVATQSFNATNKPSNVPTRWWPFPVRQHVSCSNANNRGDMYSRLSILRMNDKSPASVEASTYPRRSRSRHITCGVRVTLPLHHPSQAFFLVGHEGRQKAGFHLGHHRLRRQLRCIGIQLVEQLVKLFLQSSAVKHTNTDSKQYESGIRLEPSMT